MLNTSAEGSSPDTSTRWRRASSTVGAALAFMKKKGQEKVIGGSLRDVSTWGQLDLPENFFGLAANDAKGVPVDFSALRGKTCIVVNVASL